MIFQFEHESFNVCGDCPCWCPRLIEKGWASSEGVCYLDYEDRNRFDERPNDCPLETIEGGNNQ